MENGKKEARIELNFAFFSLSFLKVLRDFQRKSFSESFIRKKMFFCFFVILSFLFFVGEVSSFGISPARVSLDYSPGTERVVVLKIFNSERIDANFSVQVFGELSESISLSEKFFSLKSNENQKEINYTLRLPNYLSSGFHRADVVISQVPNRQEHESPFVGATVRAVSQLSVFVPYDGKYVESGLFLGDFEQGEEVVFVVPVANRGKVDLNALRADFDVYDDKSQRLASFSSEEISLSSNEKKDIVYRWKSNLFVGEYRAVVGIFADGQKISQIEQSFRILSPKIEIEDVRIVDFKFDERADFGIVVVNNKKEKARVFARVVVFDESGKLISDFRSREEEISPLDKTVLVSSWNLKGVKEGFYNVNVFLHSDGKVFRKDVRFKVSNNNLELVGLEYAPLERNEESGGNQFYLWLFLILAGLVILFAIFWFVVFRKRLFYLKSKSAEEKLEVNNLKSN